MKRTVALGGSRPDGSGGQSSSVSRAKCWTSCHVWKRGRSGRRPVTTAHRIEGGRDSNGLPEQCNWSWVTEAEKGDAVPTVAARPVRDITGSNQGCRGTHRERTGTDIMPASEGSRSGLRDARGG